MIKRLEIKSRLRRRILAAIETGVLRAGDRLPSTRELTAEMNADPRVIAAAYRELASEGLVELRVRSGAYVSRSIAPDRVTQAISCEWIADVFAAAVKRGLPMQELGPVMFDFAMTRKLRAVAVAEMADQSLGISAELKRDYGITASNLVVEQLKARQPPREILTAHVVFAAEDCAEVVRRVAETPTRRVIAVESRADLLDPEWLALLQSGVYVVATDPGFLDRAVSAIHRAGGSTSRMHLLVAGRDDLSSIPPGAPTYVTESARRAIGRLRLPGRIIRAKRLFDETTVREIVRFICTRNEELS